MSGNPVLYAETASGEYVPLRADADGNLQIDVAETEQAVTQGSDAPWSVEQANAPWRISTQDGDLTTIGQQADGPNTDETTSDTHMAFLKGLVQMISDVWDDTANLLRQNVAQIAGNAPQMDGASSGKQAVSAYGEDASAGDTPLSVTSSGRQELAPVQGTGGIGDAAAAQVLQLADEADAAQLARVATRDTLFNGGSWDRARGNLRATVLAAQTDTESDRTSADQTNFNGRGMLLQVDLSAIEGTPAYTPVVQGKANSGDYYEIFRAAATIGTAGNFAYLLYPGATYSGANDIEEAAELIIPRVWRVVLEASTADGSNRADTQVTAATML